jgi:hypothetical protein
MPCCNNNNRKRTKTKNNKNNKNNNNTPRVTREMRDALVAVAAKTVSLLPHLPTVRPGPDAATTIPLCKDPQCHQFPMLTEPQTHQRVAAFHKAAQRASCLAVVHHNIRMELQP